MEVFKKQLDNLTKISKNLDKMGKTIKNDIDKPMKSFEKSINRIQVASLAVQKTFDKLFGIVKGITLTGLGLGALVGFKGLQAKKDVVESKQLGITAQEKGALEYAGKQGFADSGFFKDMLQSIKNASIDIEKSGDFAKLGLDFQKVRKMPAIEALQEVIERAQKLKLDPSIINETIQSLAGISYQTLQNIDLDKFKRDLAEGMQYNDNSADKISKIGEGVNRLTANLSLLFDKTLASMAPTISKIFDNIAKGLNAIAQNKEFQAMLDRLGDWLSGLSSNFDTKVMDIINSIPNVIRSIEKAFLNITGFLLKTYGVVTFNKETRQEAQRYFDRADRLQLENLKSNIANAKTQTELNEATGDYLKYSKEKGFDDDVSSLVSERALKLEVPIQVNVQNDPTNALQQKTFNQSVSMGGDNYGIN